ncbi:MAG: nucleotidyltransferase family protein [Erythrobacter sp.]
MDDNARRFVISALRGLVRDRRSHHFSVPAELSCEDSASVIEVVERNKIGGLLKSGAARAGLVLREELAHALAKQQALAIARNFENLVETESVSDLLRAEGIAFVVIKGAARSFEVFGGLDARASNDIDVLVRRSDYARAGEVLCANGYIRGVPIDDRWWHDHLGESPFLPTHSRGIVDIHHKVQQPGGPAPADIEAFFATASELKVAGRTYTVPHPHYALLLAYISMSKALRNAEPWLPYAAEIVLEKHRMTAMDRTKFNTLARGQGLTRMICEIDKVLDQVFTNALAPLRKSAEYRRAEQLALAAFDTHALANRRFHRSRLLWQWTQGSGSKRLARFAGMSVQRMLCDLRRPKRSASSS